METIKLMDVESKIDLLKKVDFLGFFHESTLERIAEESREILLSAGDILFNEGDSGSTMYIILAGQIEIYKDETPINALGPGNYVGEMALIESQIRSASIRALTPCSLLEINDDQFKKYFASQPQSLLAIMKTLLARGRKSQAAEKPKPKVEDSPEKLVLPLESILDETSNEIYLFDPIFLKFTHVNTGGRQNLGYSLDELKEMTPLDIAPEFTEDEFESLIRPLRKGTKAILVIETEFQRKNGSQYPVEIRLQLSHTKETLLFLATVQNISERKQFEATIKQMAYYDPLTGLPNRNLLNDRIALALNQAHRNKDLVAVMFLDLDNFKMINDSMGHEAGDILLKSVAQRLIGCLRKVDTVSRMGGDEFIILACGLKNAKDASVLAQKILNTFKSPIMIKKSEVHIGTSIGIALFPSDGQEAHTLLKNADMAMYRAKEDGKNNFQMYTQGMHARAQERIALEKNLRRALEQKEFTMYYQPKIHLESGKVTGMEALLRWIDPELGLVTPQEFIPVAEETRLIIPLGEWILGECCQQIKNWNALGFDDINIAVNISVLQFNQPNLLKLIQNTIAEKGINPKNLELEITETLLLKDNATTIATLDALDKLGVSLTIDDFGTGYSSLSYLNSMPIKSIKIDQSFIQKFKDGGPNLAITKTIVAMGKNLGLKVIAEGIETEDQKDFLVSLGCHEGQGYLFSRPLEIEQATRFLIDINRS